jgi:hypothetical protein
LVGQGVFRLSVQSVGAAVKNLTVTSVPACASAGLDISAESDLNQPRATSVLVGQFVDAFNKVLR